jgi:hypothetical protein
MWRIEFNSDEFLPFLPEEAQSNPGVYGFELSVWVARKLAASELCTTYPLQEDWGWLLHYGDDEVLIGCASVCGEGEGYKSRAIAWSIFVAAAEGNSGAPLTDSERRIRDRICQALESEGMRPEVVEP